MAVLKYYDGSDWEPVASALIGPTGPTGVTGSTGPTGPNPGLTLINTTSFSAVSSQSINNVFSATYTNYLILINNTSQTNSTGGNFRLRVSGTDNTTASSYVSDTIQFSSGVPAGDFTANVQDRFFYSQVGATGRRSAIIELFNPFDAVHTYYHCRGRSSSAQGNLASYISAGYHNQNTSYDGFTFYPDSGTFIGTVSVYGYNK